ncbi:MAG: hypothetical protein P8X79_21645 [Reinekea sp.]
MESRIQVLISCLPYNQGQKKPKHLISLLLILLPLLNPCHGESTIEQKRYNYGFRIGGFGGHGWSIWVEDLIINDSWAVPSGTFSGGPEDATNKPPDGTLAALGELPLPRTVRARWFSYRSQTVYEAKVSIAEGRLGLVKKWFELYPTQKYLHHLVIGVSGRGAIKLWWLAGCIQYSLGCPTDYFETHAFELTPLIAVSKAEGNLDNYLIHTMSEISKGDD